LFIDNSLKHIAIIPDGNNRWAKKNGVSPIDAYSYGTEIIEKIVIRANELNIQYVTAYLMSLENFERRSNQWKKAFFAFIEKTIACYITNEKLKNVKIKTIGNLDVLPENLKNQINEMEVITSKNKNIILNIAIAYSGQDEIVRAVNKFFIDDNDSKGHTQITAKILEKYLDTAGIPSPDLLIRTSGEMRLSGFLLWQNAYTEFFFVNELWPDFSLEIFDKIIEDFYKRTRNFGKERKL
jgi:undecaprenyl diphosphate synthase